MRAALALSAVLLTVAACQTTTLKDGVDASRPNAIIQGEVERRIAELRYLHGTELLNSLSRLASMGDQAAPKMRDGLRSDDWLTRASLAWVMGATQDRRYIGNLRPLLN